MLYATEFRDDRQHHVETETCIIFNIEGVLTELTSLEGRVGLRDVPRHGGEQRDAMLRGGDGVGGGRVDDEAAVLGGGGEVDVVDPDPRAAHDAEPAPEASKTSRPTLVPDLTMSASQSEILARSSSGERP